MVVEGLESAGSFLVGDTVTQPGWLHNVLSSVSPQGDFLCLAKGQNFLLYRSSWNNGKFRLKKILQKTVSVLQEDEDITSLVVIPVLSAGRLQSISHLTALGFSTGVVRVYTESGDLIVQKCFDPSPVQHLKFQSMPEGKHSTNILYLQTIQEMLVVYERTVVSVAGLDLLETVTKNTGELAVTLAEGLGTTHLLNLKAHRLLIRDQSVADCESFVFTNTSYNQYFQITMQGGLVDDRHRPVTTKPYFLTVGQDPFLQYNQKGAVSASAGELAQNVVSTVKSGFFRVASGALGSIWSTGAPEEPQENQPDPVTNLAISHSLKDSGRQGNEVLISPNKMYSAVKDSQNRVLLVDNYSRTVIQMWRGYHRCQMGWALASSQKAFNSNDTQSPQDVAAVLVLYLPRRGLIEVWSPDQKVKVTQFHVSKNGTLIRSAGVCLDDGLPRRRDTVRVFTSFLDPDGRISHFFIPFHALSISSTREKDINAQNSINELVGARSDGFLEDVYKHLEEMRNTQLKTMTILRLVAGETEQLEPEESLVIVEKLLEAAAKGGKSQSLEQKLYQSKLTKLRQLIRLFTLTTSTSNIEKEPETEEITVENLSNVLSISEDSVKGIFEWMTEESTQEESVVLNCSDFIQCFDIEGELSSAEDKTQVRLKKDISPRLQRELSKFFCSVCCQEEANRLIAESGLNLGEILETLLNAFLRNPPGGVTIRNLSDLSKSFIALLASREGSDDRTVSNLQDISKRILLKASIGPALYTLIFLWMNALVQACCPAAYNEEWSRRAQQVSSFLKMDACYKGLGGADCGLRYSLQDVFDSGNGRISEIVCKWLLKLGADSRHLATNIDGFIDSKELTLVTKCSEFFPKSMDSNVLLVHLCWEELQRWQRDRDNLSLLEAALSSLSSIACPGLRNKFSNLIWRSFFSKPFRDLAKRTDDFRKTTLNESAICEKEFGINRDNVAALLSLLLGFIDKNLDLVKHGDNIEIAVDYDEISLNQQLHLLDHVKSTALPDLELLALEHQVAAVLFLTWRLKLPSRPLKVFNSVEINNLLSIQSTAVVSWFSDYNASVKKERVSWMEMATETATGYIHTTPDNQQDTSQYRTLINVLLQLAKVWFISGEMKVCQCRALYQSGFDSLGAEVRNSLDGKSRVCEALLEVALLRLAKYLYQDTDAGRIAAVPSQVMTELAARRSMSGSVADTSLADTLALFLWLTEVLESDDTQLLATQCVSAVQVLQVRRNRLGD